MATFYRAHSHRLVRSDRQGAGGRGCTLQHNYKAASAVVGKDRIDQLETLVHDKIYSRIGVRTPKTRHNAQLVLVSIRLIVFLPFASRFHVHSHFDPSYS